MADENRITVFAKTNFRNKEVPFGIKTDDRRRHMYLIGKTGMGKTTLMENMVIQDIRNGHGVAFLDPHGDSVQRILNSIPSNRVNDVIYFNPSDLDHPVAFNILESVDPRYKHLVASGLMGVFTKIWANLWSARMEYILNNTILALLDSPGNTLLGITRMYVDKKYRKKIVDNVKDPMVRAFWVDEFANYNEKYRTEAIAPIQNKVGQFLSSGIIRNIVGQPRSTIDLREVMDQQKILIMDLSKGKVGEDNSALLGAMLVTKIQLAAMSRTDQEEKDRKDFYLYVDEFQNFATDSFATILSEARKYRLNLIVGHQYIGQLVQEKNTKVRDAIFGNVGTLVVFRIGAEDAEFLVKEFEPIFNEIDIVNLPKYAILLKLMINGVASDPFSAMTLPPNPNFLSGNIEKVLKVSRERYANPVADVEDKISRWMGVEYHQETAVLIGADSEEKQQPVEQTINIDRPERVEIQQPAGDTVIEAPAPKPVIKNEQPVQHYHAEAAKYEERNISPHPMRRHDDPSRSARIPDGDPRRSRPEADRPPQHRVREDRPRQNPHHQQQKSPNHSAHARHSPAQRDGGGKKENPIWNTVAGIHKEKIQESHQRTQNLVKKIEDSPEEPEFYLPPTPPNQSSSDFSGSQPSQSSQLRQGFVGQVGGQAGQDNPIPSTSADERKVLQPGESHNI